MVRPKKRSPTYLRYVILATLLVGVLVLAGSLIALHVRNQHNNNIASDTAKNSHVNSVDYSPSKPNDNTANDTRKGSTNPAATLDNGPTASNTNNPLGVIILNTRRSDTDVRVGNLVNGTTSGTCTLSATQAGQASPTPVQAQVQLDVNNYDCGVMHITLPDTGTWQVKLTVTSGPNTTSAETNVGSG